MKTNTKIGDLIKYERANNYGIAIITQVSDFSVEVFWVYSRPTAFSNYIFGLRDYGDDHQGWSKLS